MGSEGSTGVTPALAAPSSRRASAGNCPDCPGLGLPRLRGCPRRGSLCRDTLEGRGSHEQTPLKMVIC